MGKNVGKSVIFNDCRWCLLMCLALLLIVLEFPQLKKGGAETSNSVLMLTRSWVEMDLGWQEDGQFGQGIYLTPCKSANNAMNGAMAGQGANDLADPHLAVFTFRALDLNRIDFNTLRVIKGVGPKIAQAILTYRQNRGPFRRIEGLLEIKGIGPAKYKVLSRSLQVKAADNS
jgi:competence ComEA-like helix-hairpin-helix protein